MAIFTGAGVAIVTPFNEDGSWGSKQKKVYILDGNGEKIYDKKKRQYKCKSVSSTDWNERSNVEKWRGIWIICQMKKNSCC